MVGRGTPGQQVGVDDGHAGSISGLRRLALTPSPASTALRVTSEPVPAVVGTATQGRPGSVIGRPAPITSRWSSGSAPVVARTAAALATSRALPPPKPSTASQPAVAATAVATTRSIDGSAATANDLGGDVRRGQRRPRTSAARAVRPVTTSTRLAPAGSAAGTSPTRPAPNRMSAGMREVEPATALPVLVVRRRVDVRRPAGAGPSSARRCPARSRSARSPCAPRRPPRPGRSRPGRHGSGRCGRSARRSGAPRARRGWPPRSRRSPPGRPRAPPATTAMSTCTISRLCGIRRRYRCDRDRGPPPRWILGTIRQCLAGSATRRQGVKRA